MDEIIRGRSKELEIKNATDDMVRFLRELLDDYDAGIFELTGWSLTTNHMGTYSCRGTRDLTIRGYYTKNRVPKKEYKGVLKPSDFSE